MPNVNINSPFRKELFHRDWRVRISTESSIGSGLAAALDISELDMQWEVEKTLKSDPNKCTLTIYNLSPEHRHQLENINLYDPKKDKTKPAARGNVGKQTKSPKTGLIRVEIEAGYLETGRSLIFRGDLRRALSTLTEDKTWVTKIEGEDGGRTVLSSRVCLSFPPGTSLYDVAEECAFAMGIGLGNILEVESVLKGKVYASGTVLDGPAATELKGVLRRAGLVYSIQDGALQFLKTGTGLRVKAILLDAYSGLVGVPERDATGLVKATALLNPELQVGGYVYLDSIDIKGTFRIVRVNYECETDGDDWYAKLELKPG